MARLCGRSIEFGMHNARTGAHALNFARPDGRAVAQRIFVLQGAGENVSDDLHIGVRVRRKASASGHYIFIDPPQGSKADMSGIVVSAEREGMAALQPARLRLA